MSRPALLRIPAPADGAALNASQQRFNRLNQQLAQAREALAEWQQQEAAFHAAHAEAVAPLHAALRRAERDGLQALDACLAWPCWRAAEQRLLRELLCEAADALLSEEGPDATVQALHDRHAPVPYAALQRQRLLAMKALAEARTGLDLGDAEDLHSPELLMARLRQAQADEAEALAAKEAAGQRAREARAARAAAQGGGGARQRRAAEAARALPSLREAYRRLASALHPDREPDPAQRAHKTALMQQVNQAYEAQDLLALLNLQLQAEQIDAQHLAQANEARLAHFNQVLAAQLADLQDARAQAEQRFCQAYALAPEAPLQAQRLAEQLPPLLRQWRHALHGQQERLARLADEASARRWLKRQKQARRAEG